MTAALNHDATPAGRIANLAFPKQQPIPPRHSRRHAAHETMIEETMVESSSPTSSAPAPGRFPSLPRQAWNLARAMADFAADGFHTVTAEEYRRRLTICDTCERRRGNRCLVCGCRLALKARGRAFRCPLGKWTREDPDRTLPDPRAEP